MVEFFIIIFIILVFIFIVFVVREYNDFVDIKNSIKATFNQIAVVLKKRSDLITQLVDVTKSYLKYERNLLKDVTKIREKDIKDPKEAEDVNITSTNLMGKIELRMEDYPKIKGDKVVMKLMDEIKKVEDEIARLRYLYNNQVQMYNTKIRIFPSSIVARIFGFKEKPYLKLKSTPIKIKGDYG